MNFTKRGLVNSQYLTKRGLVIVKSNILLYAVLPEEPGSVDTSPKEEKEPEEDFPLKKLKSLDEQLGRPKWVVPVRSKDELEMLLRAAIRLAKESKYFSVMNSLLNQCESNVQLSIVLLPIIHYPIITIKSRHCIFEGKTITYFICTCKHYSAILYRSQ